MLIINNKKVNFDDLDPKIRAKICKSPALVLLYHKYTKSEESKHLRFGQWYFNHYCTHNYIYHQELFYGGLEDVVDLLLSFLKDTHNYYIPPQPIKGYENA